jgi:hypothetical protein
MFQLSFKLLLAYTVVLSAVNVTGFPAVARVSALVSLCCCHYYCTVASVLTVLKKYPSATGVSTGSDVPIVVGIPCCSSFLLYCCRSIWKCVLTSVVFSLKSLIQLDSLLLLSSLQLFKSSCVSNIPGVLPVVGFFIVVGFPAVVFVFIFSMISYNFVTFISLCFNMQL